jgi:hypothetical protein
MNLINEFHVALMPPRRRVWFLLGGAVSSSILRGYSETEHLLEEVVDDGLDDDDPFFLVRKMRTMCGSRTGGWSLPCVMSD